MTIQRRAGDDVTKVAYAQAERFVDKENGYYVQTREGLQGPFSDLAAALNGLISNTGNMGIPNYQKQKLYKSVCEKAVTICERA